MALATNNFMTFYQFSISFLLLPNGKVSQEENLLREGVILNLHLCLPSKMYLFQAHTYTRHPFLTYGKSRGETRLIFQVVHLSLKSALPPYLNSHSQSFSSTDMRTPAWEWEHPLTHATTRDQSINLSIKKKSISRVTIVRTAWESSRSDSPLLMVEE